MTEQYDTRKWLETLENYTSATSSSAPYYRFYLNTENEWKKFTPEPEKEEIKLETIDTYIEKLRPYPSKEMEIREAHFNHELRRKIIEERIADLERKVRGHMGLDTPEKSVEEPEEDIETPKDQLQYFDPKDLDLCK